MRKNKTFGNIYYICNRELVFSKELLQINKKENDRTHTDYNHKIHKLI